MDLQTFFARSLQLKFTKFPILANHFLLRKAYPGTKARPSLGGCLSLNHQVALAILVCRF